MKNESLKTKTIKGTFWSAADAFLGQGVTFVVGVILARLLSPEEYGLIGICIICNTVLDGFVDSGFSTSLIRKKDATNADYNTMFITNMIISIVMYIALFFTTPVIANFFGCPQLESLIRVSGLIILLNGLSITQQTILTKRIDFKTKTKASIASATLSGVVGILMAYSGYGVWALVAQVVSKSAIYTICLWICNKWLPDFTFSMDSLRYMWGFGWKMLVSGLLDRVWAEAYQIVVGKFYSPSTLGQYTRSKQYAQIFSQNINTIIMRVSYPVLATIQDQHERMVAVYRKIIKMTMFVTAICLVFIGSVSEPLIYALIGEKWKMAASFLPIICISMSLYPLHAINLNMLKVLGRSDLFLIYEIIKKGIAVIPICLGIFVGIYWMLIGTVCTGIIAFFINTWYTGKKLGYTSFMQLRDISSSYIIALAIGASVYFFKYFSLPYWSILIVQIIIGGIVFFAICHLIKPEEYTEIKSIVSTMFRKKKSK